MVHTDLNDTPLFDNVEQTFEHHVDPTPVSTLELTNHTVSNDEVAFLTKGDPTKEDIVMSLWFDGLKLLVVADEGKGCRYFTKFTWTAFGYAAPILGLHLVMPILGLHLVQDFLYIWYTHDVGSLPYLTISSCFQIQRQGSIYFGSFIIKDRITKVNAWLKKALPVFTFANQAGVDMLETTLVDLQDITLEKLIDDNGRKVPCEEFPKIMQQGFAYLPGVYVFQA